MSAATLGAVPQRPAWRSPVVPWLHCLPPRRALLRETWRLGEISHQLTPSQFDTYQRVMLWESRPSREAGRYFVMDSSRRWGKSKLGLGWLTEKALRSPNLRLLYIGPVLKEIRKFVVPLMAAILSECPPELRPRYRKTDLVYEFPNGSRVEVVALDKNPDGARGNALDYAFLDEAAFFNNLEYLLGSVLDPQMLGRPHARVLMASTPPVSPGHVWSSDLVPDAKLRDAHDIKTLADADQYTVEEIEEFIAKAGGRDHPKCQREYFCRHVADFDRAVVPEFAAVQGSIVTAVEPPGWRDCYTVMDPGWHDMTGVLFGYWDFAQAKLVVEDELAHPKMNSGKLAALIKAKEEALWNGLVRVGRNGELKPQPYRRYSDRDPRLLSDLRNEHQIIFTRATKDTPEQAVNLLRNAIGEERILVHPRCTKLQLHLLNGIWKNEQHKAFAWLGGEFGHFDLVSALLYMWRNVNRRRNPAPQQAVVLTTDQHQAVQREREAASRWTRERSPSQWSKAAPEPRTKWTREGGRFVRSR